MFHHWSLVIRILFWSKYCRQALEAIEKSLPICRICIHPYRRSRIYVSRPGRLGTAFRSNFLIPVTAF